MNGLIAYKRALGVLFLSQKVECFILDVVSSFVCDFLRQEHFEREDIEWREKFNSLVRFCFASVRGHQISKKRASLVSIFKNQAVLGILVVLSCSKK